MSRTRRRLRIDENESAASHYLSHYRADEATDYLRFRHGAGPLARVNGERGATDGRPKGDSPSFGEIEAKFTVAAAAASPFPIGPRAAAAPAAAADSEALAALLETAAGLESTKGELATAQQDRDARSRRRDQGPGRARRRTQAEHAAKEDLDGKSATTPVLSASQATEESSTYEERRAELQSGSTSSKYVAGAEKGLADAKSVDASDSEEDLQLSSKLDTLSASLDDASKERDAANKELSSANKDRDGFL